MTMSTHHPAVQARAQQGMSLIGFIFLLVFVLFAVYIGIKLVPIYLNHMSVVSEIKAVADEPGAANQPPNSIRRDLITRLQVSYVEHVTAQHVTIERGPPPALVVEYEVETHLIGNIDAIVKFRSVHPLRN
ncbi:DUF4845 domain-containing protein [Wenzhouxiangella marina]|uniref:Uncharacterized protein n=1 Tax=Wenzhouxiangella marina TaxID=1579979 RepID=A0A0K0XXL3_9GAMM|nr:DUF4845 domain-containing protein [Wenzhouxiangella marina]AKS42439.1 hypothetical protein WM2015_2074 [Wenzhouxiangella marina]MBB6085786.1 hypothetical protein [Wenzhouxiangella marina]